MINFPLLFEKHGKRGEIALSEVERITGQDPQIILLEAIQNQIGHRSERFCPHGHKLRNSGRYCGTCDVSYSIRALTEKIYLIL